MPQSFNVKQVSHVLGKAIPELVAELNDKYFNLVNQMDDTIVISNWAVDQDGQMIHLKDDEIPSGYTIVPAEELIE